uniref:Uncharacterized protein n=1 Tax=Arsenophonus nasoniae TaxID=638 RepID=D2U2M4_9GAMM|nr:hypothetical protein ARN_28500 [Arsenophonus nasoniae]
MKREAIFNAVQYYCQKCMWLVNNSIITNKLLFKAEKLVENQSIKVTCILSQQPTLAATIESVILL